MSTIHVPSELLTLASKAGAIVWSVLRAAEARGEVLTQQELARRSRSNPKVVTGHVRNLQRVGLLEVERDYVGRVHNFRTRWPAELGPEPTIPGN